MLPITVPEAEAYIDIDINININLDTVPIEFAAVPLMSYV